MEAPSAADIRSWSRVEFSSLGLAVADPDPLKRFIDSAVAWLFGTDGVLGYELEDFPVAKEPLANDAIQMLVEFNAYRRTGDQIETIVDYDTIKSFTAGDYTETRRSLVEQSLVLHPYPDLNQLLQFLMNPEKRGQNGPAVSGPPAPNWDKPTDSLRGRPTNSAYRPFGF